MFHMMLVMFDIMFWMFRVAVAFCSSMQIDIGFEPINSTAEIIVIFISLFCILFIAKKKLFGGIAYLITYGAYFGVYVYKTLGAIIDGQGGFGEYTSLFVAIIAIILALVTFASIGITGSGKTKDGKTDWFFNNKDLDRKKDERDDTNQYKF